MKRAPWLIVIGLALLILFAGVLFFTVLNEDDDTETWSEKGEKVGEDESTASRRHEFKSHPNSITNSAEASGDLKPELWEAKFGAALERGRARLALKIKDAKGKPLVSQFAANAQLRLSVRQGSFWLDRPLVYDWENSEILCPPPHHPGLGAGRYRLEASFGSYGDIELEFELGRDENQVRSLQTNGFLSEVVLSFRDVDGATISYLSRQPQYIPQPPKLLLPRPQAVPPVFSVPTASRPQPRDLVNESSDRQTQGPLAVIETEDGKFHLPVIASNYGVVRVALDQDPLFESPDFERQDDFLSPSQRSIEIQVSAVNDYDQRVIGLSVSNGIRPGWPNEELADSLRFREVRGTKGRQRVVPPQLPEDSVLLRISPLKKGLARPWAAAEDFRHTDSPSFFEDSGGPWCLLKLKTPYLFGAHDGMGFFTRPTSFFSGDDKEKEFGAEIEINRQALSLSLEVPHTLAAWARHVALLWHFPDGVFATSLRNQKAWRGAKREGQEFRFDTAVDAAWPSHWPDSTEIEFRLSSSIEGQSYYGKNGKASALPKFDIHMRHKFGISALKSAGETQTELSWKSLGPAASSTTGFLARCVGDFGEGLPWVEGCLVSAKQDLAALRGLPLERKDESHDGRLQVKPYNSWHNPQSHYHGDDEGYFVVPADRAKVMTAGENYVLYLWSRSRDPNQPDRRIVFRAQQGWTDLGVIRLASY